ncbi:MAG: TolB protein [Actinomycetota bacterium]|jgi:TolB protein|nr:TolB protein [Actinomycetota bacterium]
MRKAILLVTTAALLLGTLVAPASAATSPISASGSFAFGAERGVLLDRPYNVTTREFSERCAIPASQGVEAYVVELPDGLSRVTGDTHVEWIRHTPYNDIYLEFYGADCAYKGNAGVYDGPDGMTENGSFPPGTHYIVVAATVAGPVDFTLTAGTKGSLPESDADITQGIVFSRGTGDVPWYGTDFGTEIYKTNATGTNVTRLTDNNTFDSAPSWSPDGKMIAFLRYTTDSVASICVMQSDGSLQRTVVDLGHVASSATDSLSIGWSPDGTRLAYSLEGIHVVNLVDTNEGDGINDEGSVSRLTNAATSPDWSPDGQWIVFSRRIDSGARALWIMRADGSEQRQLTAPLDPMPSDSDAAWSANGSQILFSRGGLGVHAGDAYAQNSGVYGINVDGTGLQPLSVGLGEGEPSPSPSGDRFVYVGRDGDLYLRTDLLSSETRLTTDGNNSSPDWTSQ